MMRLVIMGKAITKLEQEIQELRKIVDEMKLKMDTSEQLVLLEDKIVKKGLIRGGAKNINPAEAVR